MKINSIISFLMITLSLTGCMATQSHLSDSRKLNEHFHKVNSVEYARKTSDKTFELCINTVLYSDNEAKRVTIAMNEDIFKIPYRHGFIAKSGSSFYFTENSITPGCIVPDNASLMQIKRINLDHEIDNVNQINQYLMDLPVGDDFFTIYVVTSKKFLSFSSTCGFWNRPCQRSMVDHWPMILIKSRRKNIPYFIEITNGHTGEQRGVNPVKLGGAAVLDIVTSPVQIGLLLYMWAGGIH